MPNSRRGRLLEALQGRTLEHAFHDPLIRVDLELEAAEHGPGALMTPEMLILLRALLERGPSPRASAGVAVIVPGLMACPLIDLSGGGLGRIWSHPSVVTSATLTALQLGPYLGSDGDLNPDVRIAASAPSPFLYDLLRLALEGRGFAVEVVAFDWRKDLELAANRLAGRLRSLAEGGRRVHLLAHSQGALVARRAVQILGRFEARRIVRRMVLLAPISSGSFAAALALSGQPRVARLGCRPQIGPPPRAYQSLWASMTGLYQCLPWDARRAPSLDRLNLADAEVWRSEVDAIRLAKFHGWGRSLDVDFIDDRSAVVVGDNHGDPTLGGVTADGSQLVEVPEDALTGDGVVPHSCAVMPGLPTYLAPGTRHASLAADRRAIGAAVALLEGRPVELPGLSSDPGDHLARPEPIPADAPAFELNGVFLDARPGTRLEADAGPDELPTIQHYRHRRDQLRIPQERLIFQATPPNRTPHPDRSAQPATRPSVRLAKELILDASNLLPFDFLRTGERIGRAVVKIQRGDGAAGTGFLVGRDILLTNNHVLPDRAAAAGAYAMVNYERSTPGDPGGRPSIAPLNPGALFITDPELDFTFCGVDGIDFLGPIRIDRDSFNIIEQEFVNIIQHPRGRPKEIVLQENRVIRVDNLVLQYTCDTEPGSSGSPVFNNQWNLVALHHASVVADGPGGYRSARADHSASFLNEGIRLSAIALWLETHEPDSLDQRRQVDRLRAILHGLDPQVGFFGALGRRVRGRSAADVVAECYRGDSAELDLVYWDLRAAGPLANDRLDDLARVVADMRMDLWLLDLVGPANVRALCDYLATEYQLDYGHLHVSAGEGLALAVVYPRSAGLTVERPDWDDDDRPGAPLRLQVRVTPRRGEPVDIQVVAFPRRSPIDEADPDRAADDRARLAESGPDPAVDRLVVGAAATLGDPEALRILTGSSVALRAATGGPDGAIILAQSPGSRVDRLFGSSNLIPIVGPPPGSARDLPVSAKCLGDRHPIAVRLAFGDESRLAPAPLILPPPIILPPVASPPTTPADDTLEQTLKSLLIRMLAEGRLNLADLLPGANPPP